eukprot:7021692-Alexandrium_andersonii.AAC.1
MQAFVASGCLEGLCARAPVAKVDSGGGIGRPDPPPSLLEKPEEAGRRVGNPVGPPDPASKAPSQR